MKLGTRSRIAVAAAVLSTGALLGPIAPAAATYPQCVPDHCDSVAVYYSDATYTTMVGVFGGDACGEMAWGVTSPYLKHVWRTC
jgi:hypothetical protein